MLGLILNAILACLSNFFDTDIMSSNSNGDSTLKDKIPALRALSISNLVLPTPEKTTLDESTPASNALSNSPSDTRSAPNPKSNSVFNR